MRRTAVALMIAGWLWYVLVIAWWLTGTLLFAFDFSGRITGSVAGDIIVAVVVAAWSGARYAAPGLLGFALGLLLYRARLFEAS